MKPYPHNYAVEATVESTGSVKLLAAGLPTILSAPPVEFDGPGDLWSPESLLVAALADCFALTFQGIARVNRLEWSQLVCRAEGDLDRREGVTRFLSFRVHARLMLPPGADEAKGRSLLAKAEKACLVKNSLAGSVELLVDVVAS